MGYGLRPSTGLDETVYRFEGQLVSYVLNHQTIRLMRHSSVFLIVSKDSTNTIYI